MYVPVLLPFSRLPLVTFFGPHDGEERRPAEDPDAANGIERRGIAVDSTHVYWMGPNFGGGGNHTPTVMSIPLLGGAATTLASGVQGQNIVVGGGNVYWTSAGQDAVESSASREALSPATAANRTAHRRLHGEALRRRVRGKGI
jgi:hypothetical protein